MYKYFLLKSDKWEGWRIFLIVMMMTKVTNIQTTLRNEKESQKILNYKLYQGEILPSPAHEMYVHLQTRYLGVFFFTAVAALEFSFSVPGNFGSFFPVYCLHSPSLDVHYSQMFLTSSHRLSLGLPGLEHLHGSALELSLVPDYPISQWCLPNVDCKI